MNDPPRVTQAAMFEIPMWTAQLDNVVPYHEEMVAELEALIDEELAITEPERYLAHQTASDPFNLPSNGWKILERATNNAFTHLAHSHFQRWRSGEFHLRRWAIRLGRLSMQDQARLKRDGIHNHFPALFSSVYYLQVPDEFVDRPEGGTRFFNPLGHLMDFMGHRTFTMAPREGRLAIFPAFLDHSPVPVEWEADEQTRIVVSCDVFYVSGEALRGSGHVMPARSHRD